MFDRDLSQLVRPAPDAAGQPLARTGLTANALTFAGFVIGLLATLATTQ